MNILKVFDRAFETKNNMKRQIRRSVFETNSSSVHSIVVKYNGEYDVILERDQQNLCAVVAHCRDYSGVGHDEPYVISTQQEKFNYLITWIVCRCKYSYERLCEYWLYNDILNVLKRVDPEINTIIILDEDKAAFDHQTAPYDSSDFVIDIYKENEIMNFIFNDNITLECYFD